MEENVIELWQEHECLYDISTKMYYNRAEKEKRWTEIANALQQPGELVKIQNIFFKLKIQLANQHHITFKPLRLLNISINCSISKYNNIRSLTF